jgi:hypothetical protein
MWKRTSRNYYNTESITYSRFESRYNYLYWSKHYFRCYFENATYLWNTGAETATIEVSTEGTYSVTVTLDGCTATDSKLVSVLNPPTTFNIGKDTSYCGTFTRTISTSNGEVATWSTGATATSITVNEAGTYTATISNQCGSEQAEITITQKALPTVDLRADTTICTGASITLDATFRKCNIFMEYRCRNSNY